MTGDGGDTGAATGADGPEQPRRFVSNANKIGYSPPLDGMRGLGVMMVLLVHGAFVAFASFAAVVDMFFVVSGFLITKINYSSGNKNEAFLGQYPDIQGYPFIFVLEKDGTFLHAQNTGDLEEGQSYNEEVLLAFLNEWAPKG